MLIYYYMSLPINIYIGKNYDVPFNIYYGASYPGPS